VWGPAVSYNPGKDHSTIVAHDKDILAVMSLMWACIGAYMPQEVVHTMKVAMDKTGMLRMATALIAEGKVLGYWVPRL